MVYHIYFLPNTDEATRKSQLLRLKTILSKKNKGIKQIIEGSFNRNNRKINHQHYDHSYAKNMITYCVNDDCLAEIFTYVPICERPKISLVCKKWKRALDDSWFRVKKLELIYWRYHKYPNFLKNYPTIEGKLGFLESLLIKCGRYLTTLDLTAYEHCNIVPVINDCCPNLVKLRLRFTSIDDGMLFNAFTRLSKLKSLTIIFQNMEGKLIPLVLINSLKNVANTLNELNLLHFIDHINDSCDYPKEFNFVIRELKVMEKFEVAGIRGFEDLFRYFKDNKKLKYFNHNYYLTKSPHVLQPLIHIQALDLKLCYIKDDSLYTIANTIKRLKVLYICCEWITDDGIAALSKMKYLRTFILFGNNNVTDSSIKLLKNIVRVSLPWSNKITDVSLTKLLENSPGMERLYVMGTSVTVEFVKKAAEISNNRKQLLTIWIPFIPDIKQYESPYFKINTTEIKDKLKLSM